MSSISMDPLQMQWCGVVHFHQPKCSNSLFHNSSSNMTQLYFKSRFFFYNQGQGRYTLSYLYNQQRPDYLGNVTIKDTIISDDQYTDSIKMDGELFKSLVVVECPDDMIEAVRYDLNEFYKPMFNLAELTPEQAIEFVRSNTILEETENGTFLISEEVEFDGIVTPAKYITIHPNV